MKTIESMGWLAAALLAVGCSNNTVALDGGGSGTDDGNPVPTADDDGNPLECSSNSDCGDDYVCIGGECRPDEPEAPFVEPPACSDSAVARPHGGYRVADAARW